MYLAIGVPFSFHFQKKSLGVKVLYIRTGLAFVQSGSKCGQSGLVFFQTTKTFSDDLTSIVISAT